MLSLTVFSILFFLAAQVFPVALGIDKKSGFNGWLFALLLAAGQVLLMALGYLLGARFMHLMNDFRGSVLLVVFFLIGIRLLMETYQVWKGNRTYILDSFRIAAFAGLAQGINAFLVGLCVTFLPVSEIRLFAGLFVFSLVFAIAGLLIPAGKNSVTFAAFLFALGGLFLLAAAVYLGFFAF